MPDLVVVTGANGFVGRRFTEYLAELQVPVRAVVRRWAALESLPATVEPMLVSDPLDARAWAPALEGASTLVHLAGAAHGKAMHGSTGHVAHVLQTSVETTAAVAAAVRSSTVQRFVLLSSIKAVGEGGDASYTETTACAPEDLYGSSKLASEEAVRRSAGNAFQYVILRPPLVYGPGVKGNFARLLRLVSAGVPLPFGAVTNRRHMLYIENAVSALATAATYPMTESHTLLLADGESFSTPEIVRMLAAGLGCSCRLIDVPDIVLRSGAFLCGQNRKLRMLTGNLEVSSALIRQQLGWTPTTTTRDGISATAQAYQAAHR